MVHAAARTVALALVLAAPVSLQAQTREVPQSRGDAVLSFAPIVKRVQPAVVNVYASRTERQPRNPLFDDPVFRQFFGNGARPGSATTRSLGSGVLVDASGLIVTNYHVIQGMTDVKIALSDRREFEAKIVLRDQRTDLAVLRIDAKAPLPFMELGESDAIEVGDLVLAMGNPFGVGQTVTQGIISALSRTTPGNADYGFYIQTDAAINPGNSGGALVDMRGRLEGINSAIYSQSGGSIGIGFAIPVDMVKVVLAAARNGGVMHRPWLGASMQSVTKDIADSFGLDRPSGVLITEVQPKSPAEAAGLKRGDLLTKIDGQDVEDPESLGYRLATKPLGGTAQLTVLQGGKPEALTLKLTGAPEQPPRDKIVLSGASPLAGATVVNISPATTDEYALRDATSGVAIVDIADGSAAANVNFQKGDVILAVNDKPIANTRDLDAATKGTPYYWKLTLKRGGERSAPFSAVERGFRSPMVRSLRRRHRGTPHGSRRPTASSP